MPASTDHLTLTFAALADPTRRAILSRLAKGDTSVTELARPFDLSLPNISKHLKVLERAHLITRTRDAQWRPCRLDPKPLKDIADWVDEYKKFWEERFDRLDEYLKELQAGTAKPNPKSAPQPNPRTRTPRPTKEHTHARRKA